MPRQTYAAIQKELAKLRTRAAALETARSAKKSKAIAQVRALMKKLGLQPTDLAAEAKPAGGATKRAPKPIAKNTARKAVAAKYRDPASGTTWSGRGRTPTWLAAYIAQGRTKEEFAIDAPAAAAA